MPAPTCMRCHVAHDPRAECFEALAEIVTRLLHQVGQEAQCRGCRATIFWVEHRNGKRVPYDPNGLSHFASCPHADRFRKPAAVPA